MTRQRGGPVESRPSARGPACGGVQHGARPAHRATDAHAEATRAVRAARTPAMHAMPPRPQAIAIRREATTWATLRPGRERSIARLRRGPPSVTGAVIQIRARARRGPGSPHAPPRGAAARPPTMATWARSFGAGLGLRRATRRAPPSWPAVHVGAGRPRPSGAGARQDDRSVDGPLGEASGIRAFRLAPAWGARRWP